MKMRFESLRRGIQDNIDNDWFKVGTKVDYIISYDKPTTKNLSKVRIVTVKLLSSITIGHVTTGFLNISIDKNNSRVHRQTSCDVQGGVINLSSGGSSPPIISFWHQH